MGYSGGGVAQPIFIWEVDYKNDDVVVQGTWGVKDHSSHWRKYAHSNDATKAQNDEITLHGFYCPETTEYQLDYIVVADVGHGIMHIFINGVDVAQVDTYAGVVNYNLVGSVSLGTLTKGAKVIRIKTATKHASATSYRITFQYLGISKVMA